MIELITGTPGSYKTATAVLEICMKVPGSFVEAQGPVTSHGVSYKKGDQVPRHLFANIKGLLVEHSPIDDEAMRTWHTWAQAGDVIVFDEAQSLWRPRAVGSKVPEEIQALETHRHMGVDLVAITQHPMLVDANLRRLVNKHRHLRRLPAGVVMEYEWDHCGQPGSYKTCVRTGIRKRPGAAFKEYQSATLHTKPKTNAPLGLLVLALVGVSVAAYQGPQLYDRFTKGTNITSPATAPKPGGIPGLSGQVVAAAAAASAATAPASAAVVSASPVVPAPPQIAGCMEARIGCRCYDEAGVVVFVVPAECRARLPQGGKPVDLVGIAPELHRVVANDEQTARDIDVWRSLRTPDVSGGYGANVLRLMGTTIARPGS